MKIQPYVNKMNNSPEYKQFIKQNSDAFLAAGFFIIDYESGNNIHQIDLYVPSKKKVAAFTLDKKIIMQMMDLMHAKAPEKLDINTKIDLDALKGILEDEMKNRNITEEVKKIIAILQTVDGKKIWNLNCILSGMELLRVHIEDDSKSILKMEKFSMLDFVKKMSPEQLKGVIQQQGAGAGKGKASSADIKVAAGEKLKKLDELEKQIEKEKENLQKDISPIKESKKIESKPAKKSKK
jgi:hypothetical protein